MPHPLDQSFLSFLGTSTAETKEEVAPRFKTVKVIAMLFFLIAALPPDPLGRPFSVYSAHECNALVLTF